MKPSLRTLRWIALIGLALVALSDLRASFPLQPRQGYGIVLFGLVAVAAALVALVLMPRAAGTLARSPDLLIPLALVTAGWRLIGWLAGLPVLHAVLAPSYTLRFVNLSFAISMHFILTIALAVGYATWTTAAVLALVQDRQPDPCAALPTAWQCYGRVLGVESICWIAVFTTTSALLLLMPMFGFLALVPMALFAVILNFSTAALLPVVVAGPSGFWGLFRDGIRTSLAGLRRWWRLILAQLILLGVVVFLRTSWSDGNHHHTNINWNVSVFWTGGYEQDCRWYGKMVEAYKTSKIPVLDTLLGLLCGTLAVAIKLAIVQRLQPEAPPVIGAPPVVPLSGPTHALAG